MIGDILTNLLWVTTESYINDKSSIKSKTEIFRELLIQEVSYNLEILNLLSQKKQSLTENQKSQLLAAMDFEKFESFSQTGIPFKSIIEGKWDKKSFRKYSKLVENIDTKAQLVTRSYHRLKLFRLKEQLDIKSSQLTLNYVTFLFVETKKALKD